MAKKNKMFPATEYDKPIMTQHDMRLCIFDMRHQLMKKIYI